MLQACLSEFGKLLMENDTLEYGKQYTFVLTKPMFIYLFQLPSITESVLQAGLNYHMSEFGKPIKVDIPTLGGKIYITFLSTSNKKLKYWISTLNYALDSIANGFQNAEIISVEEGSTIKKEPTGFEKTATEVGSTIGGVVGGVMKEVWIYLALILGGAIIINKYIK